MADLYGMTRLCNAIRVAQPIVLIIQCGMTSEAAHGTDQFSHRTAIAESRPWGYLWGVRTLLIPMVVSLSGRVQHRIINSRGELMDAVSNWALCGEKTAGISAIQIVNN
jgi:hypothetical protein